MHTTFSYSVRASPAELTASVSASFPGPVAGAGSCECGVIPERFNAAICRICSNRCVRECVTKSSETLSFSHDLRTAPQPPRTKRPCSSAISRVIFITHGMFESETFTRLNECEVGRSRTFAESNYQSANFHMVTLPDIFVSLSKKSVLDRHLTKTVKHYQSTSR
jgi:hypothetical protein